MSHEKKLSGKIERVENLDLETRQTMFALMNEFYHADEAVFFHDLDQKNRVILLFAPENQLKGFTSARIFDLGVDGETVKVLFSGDTIIHPDYWGTLELPRIWGHFMLETLAEIGTTPLYWFLISSGYRTYRFLPAYFHEFFPRFDKATPAEMQQILDAAAKTLFAERYDNQSGLIKLEHPTPLRQSVADSGEEKRGNPHIDFFLSRNPGCVEGEELACITRLTLDNIKPFVKRLLKR